MKVGVLNSSRVSINMVTDDNLPSLATSVWVAHKHGQTSAWNTEVQVPTVRSVQRDDALDLEAAGNHECQKSGANLGQPIVDNDFKFFANYGSTITDTVKFYGHANYASKRVEGGFYFRNPNTRSAVFSGDGGDSLLVGNLLGLPEGADSAADDIPIVNHVPDAEGCKRCLAIPIYSHSKRYFLVVSHRGLGHMPLIALYSLALKALLWKKR